MSMKPSAKMSVGAALAAVGAVGMALGPSLGLADLARPWSFVAGFFVGVMAGLGGTLALAGLIESRKGS